MIDQFNQVLYFINNNILLTIIGIVFGIQVLYILLFFVRAKKYPKAKVNHRFGIVIPARNEEDVIGDTVKCLLASDYPRELFDVFVVADNCTDRTAEIARAAGAIVYERFDDDPKHRKAGYALKYLFERIREEFPGKYEAYIKFDADNLMEPDYISRMNDAFDTGVKSAHGYSNSKNIDQNVVAGISGLWYIRDCRFACNFRSAIGQGTMLGGAGMMFSAEIIEKHNGWDCLSTSDDAEFTMRRLNEDKIKTMYVKDAIVYEDQPSTIKDTFRRYKRMARPLHNMFYTQGLKSFFLFFARWKWTYLDMFMTLMFIPICVLMCLWLPVYYGYLFIYNGIMGFKYGNAACLDVFWTNLTNVCLALAFAFVVAFILQALLAVVLERKRLKTTMKKMMPAVLLFPAFMIIYAAAITIGVFSKPQWQQVKRNPNAGLALQSLAAETAATEENARSAEQSAEPEPEEPMCGPSTEDVNPHAESGLESEHEHEGSAEKTSDG